MISIPMLGALAASRTQPSISVPAASVVLSCSCNGSVVDASVYNHQLTTYGPPEFVGDAAIFDGVNDYCAMAAVSPHLSLGVGDFSIKFEAKKSKDSSAGYDYVLCTDASSGSTYNGWRVELSTSRGFAFISQTNGLILINQPTTINDGLWHTWEVRRDQGVFKLLRDEVVIKTYTHSKPYDLISKQRLAIGANAGLGQSNFNGALRKIVIDRPGYAG